MTARPAGASGGSPTPRLLLLTPNLDNNSLGRTYCLWLLARHLGYDVRVASVTGERVWAPLAGTAFAQDCRRVPAPVDGRPGTEVGELARWSDLLVAVKPVENSFGLGLALREELGRPLLLDVDDPDIEVRTTWLPWYERLARRVLRPRYRRLLRLKEEALRTPTLVSNPGLQAVYGGSVVPHVRPAAPYRERATTGTPVVRFVGSPRGHKGLDVLRVAVGRLADRGFRLEVTADAPADAAPWETWLGTTTLERGRELVASADVVAVPSLSGGWAPLQLPAKLVDAMMAGAAVVASDVGPIAWALDGTGLLVRPGDVDGLTAALASLTDPARREELGRRAHERALATFSVESVAPVLGAVVDDLLRTGGAVPGPLPDHVFPRKVTP
ncbi:glycosyltransferase [Thalassiella azotivora]